MDRGQVDVADRLAPYEAHRLPVASHGTSFDGLIWLDDPDRTDLGDGRCTNHPDRCMIPGCDHTAEPQAGRDRERWGLG